MTCQDRALIRAGSVEPQFETFSAGGLAVVTREKRRALRIVMHLAYCNHQI